MNQEKIGKFISEKRKEKKLTQQQLAEKLGVTNKAISKWENGKCMPDISIIKDLCDILGITVTTLLNGEENKDDEIVIELLWIIDKFRQLRYALAGLVICCLGDVIQNMRFAEWLKDETFFKGFYDGLSVGLKLVGVFIFAYGCALYIKKNLELKKWDMVYYKKY